MPDDYDFPAYLKRVEDFGYAELLRDADRMASSIEASSFGCKGAVERRKKGSLEFVQRLKELLWWLHNGTRPSSADDYSFQLFRPICERLVAKGQLKPEALSVFDNSQSTN